MKNVLENMQVNEEQMKENIGKSYNVFFSQQLLLKMIEKGMLREEAYRVVQRNAHEAFNNRTPFDEQIKEDQIITTLLTKKELADVFNFKKYTANIDIIYDRVYK